MENKSDFGKGLVYCLGLFLAHEYMKEVNVEIWFNGAGDHLFELEIPKNYPTEIKQRLSQLQTKCLRWRLYDNPQEEDKEWAIREAKDLLRSIDNFNGISTMRGTWE